MDKPSAILKNLLPGAWPKTIFGVSIVLSGILYKFYPDLPTTWLPTSEVERFLWRLIVTGISLLLGAAALIASLIHELHKKFKLDEDNAILKLQVIENQKTIDTLSKTAYDLMKRNGPPPKKDEWDHYSPMTSPDGFVYFKNTDAPGLFACAACKGMEPNPIILQPVRNAHTPGVYQCINCKTWGVIT